MSFREMPASPQWPQPRSTAASTTQFLILPGTSLLSLLQPVAAGRRSQKQYQ